MLWDILYGVAIVAAILIVFVIAVRLIVNRNVSSYTTKPNSIQIDIVHRLVNDVAPRLGSQTPDRRELARQLGISHLDPVIYMRFAALRAVGQLSENKLLQELSNGVW